MRWFLLQTWITGTGFMDGSTVTTVRFNGTETMFTSAGRAADRDRPGSGDLTRVHARRPRASAVAQRRADHASMTLRLPMAAGCTDLHPPSTSPRQRHTGEVQAIGGKVGGIAVHIGARVASEAVVEVWSRRP